MRLNATDQARRQKVTLGAIAPSVGLIAPSSALLCTLCNTFSTDGAKRCARGCNDTRRWCNCTHCTVWLRACHGPRLSFDMTLKIGSQVNDRGGYGFEIFRTGRSFWLIYNNIVATCDGPIITRFIPSCAVCMKPKGCSCNPSHAGEFECPLS